MQYTTNFSDLDLNGSYSYADYLLWRFEQSVELIKGKVFKISPQFFSVPFDVRLLDRAKSGGQNKDIYAVVQPDLCVIRDKEKLDEKGVIFAE